MANFHPKIIYGDGAEVALQEILFETPPDGDPLSEVVGNEQDEVVSSTGEPQINHHFTRTTWTLTFSWIPYTLKETFAGFVETWAKYGREFDYQYEEDDPGTASAVRLTKSTRTRGIKYERQLPDGNGDFLYKFSFEVERVTP